MNVFVCAYKNKIKRSFSPVGVIIRRVIILILVVCAVLSVGG